MPLCEIPYTWPRTASKQASKQASKWLHAACFTLTLASLPATGCDSEPEYVDQELIGPFDADDGQTVRVHDFIASDPTVLYRMQMDHEIPFYRGPREAPHGTRVSIVSTGYYARELGRQYDLVVEGHRRTIRAPRGESVGVAQEPVNCSAGVPVDDPLFPWYDPDGAAFNGGIATELESMHNPTIGINVSSIGTSLEGRDIFAVQIGPREPVRTTPTVYLAGTYHAREWVTTAVMMELTRWLRDVASSGGAIEGTLYADLYDRAVVLVPVVNVDGYQYTRTESVSGDPGREHRKNRRNTCETLDGLADGVDLNRNHSTAWSEPADGTDTLACAERYRGEAPASEPETVAMETLLDGSIFAGGTPSPVAMVSYHSYGDFLVYPAGWLAPGDEGPECAIKWGNCFNADFTAYRRLFGDTENPILQATPPYIADHGALVLYSVSGDTTLHGHYGPVPMLSMTPEMTNVTSGFYVECESDPGAIIDQLVDQNKDLIRRLVRESDALAARDPSAPASSYVTRELGRLGPGFMVREAPDITDHETSRAVFVKPVWLPSDTGRLNAFLVPGGASSFDPLRRGVHYRLYGLPMPDPVCLPTSIASEQDDFVSEDVIPGSFVECVRMDDPDRLVSEGGWILMSEDRGGEVDWFWTGGMDGDTLTYPRTEGLDEEGFTGCYFSFSLFWSGQLDGTVVLEREVVGGAFEEVARWPRGSPDPDAENFQYPFSSRLKSFAYEASAHLPEARPAFRFRVENGDVPNLQIFDPISYCRRGALY